jgi:peroxiredoxin/glycine/D-amino acid oxidase-like deaminating enzyme
MQVVIALPIGGPDRKPFTTPNMHWAYGPGEPQDETALVRRLTALGAQGLICDKVPARAALQEWRDHSSGPLLLICSQAPGFDCPRGVEVKQMPLDQAGLAEALAVLERWSMTRNLTQGYPTRGTGNSVVLVGAGITNLVLAVELVDRGYDVEIVDAKPAPGGNNWYDYGCSHAGGDARMFTLTEMDNYNSKTSYVEQNPLFQTKVTEGGWLFQKSGLRSAEEIQWLETHNTIPPWLASAYSRDIYELNADAMALWDTFIETHPVLFDKVVMRDGVLRLYNDADQYTWDIQRQTRLGALKQTYGPAQIEAEFPALRAACENGRLAGAIMVKGFTLNVHKFTQNVLAYLEKADAVFQWNTKVDKVLRNRDNKITGLLVKGVFLQADHYIVSPGIYGEHLMQDTPCAGQIHGILGAWLEIPNTTPALNHSMKLARKGHIAEDSNITVARDENGTDSLIIGSGYGYIGNFKSQWYQSPDIDQDQLSALYAALDDTAAAYFTNDAEEAATVRPAIAANRKYCIRPWTPTSLGLYHSEETENHGSLIITGGHNTGGFAQATVIAQAALETLRGKPHKLHGYYHPSRHANFVRGTLLSEAPRSVPDIDFHIRVRDGNIAGDNPFRWEKKASADLFRGKRVVLFALPGAFTPTCSTYQLPGFEDQFEEFEKMGVDDIYCLSVNDSFVMNKWAQAQNIKRVKVIPDGSGIFTKQMGMLVDKSNLGFGLRSWRYAAVIRDGLIEAWFEEPGREDRSEFDPYGITAPENILRYLQKSESQAAQ